MLKSCICLLLFGCIQLFLSVPVFAQQAPLINGDFSNLRFPQFVQKVESSTPYFFYYNSMELDSFNVNTQANGITLQQLLTTVFQNTVYHFSVDSLNRVFITERIPIVTVLPADFFNKNKSRQRHINSQLISFG